MGSDGAVNIIHRAEIHAAGASGEALRKEKVAEYKDKFANPYVAAERGYVDEVIEPALTRRKLIGSLRLLENKRDTNPPRKHGNIPL
jgi:propionyl-CoA carboxylase beta chain